jgi:Skp family chaperone for outer membrane proteins
LITVRSRASRDRPFTVVKKMQADAEAVHQNKLKELQASLAETQSKLSELERTKQGDAGQRFILSPEQQQEIANFKKKQAQTNTDLRLERKKLRADVDSLETRIKWANIAGMPFLVIIAGVALAINRRKKQAAR